MTSKFPFDLGPEWRGLQEFPPEVVINIHWIKEHFIDRKDIDIRGMDEEMAGVWFYVN